MAAVQSDRASLGYVCDSLRTEPVLAAAVGLPGNMETAAVLRAIRMGASEKDLMDCARHSKEAFLQCVRISDAAMGHLPRSSDMWREAVPWNAWCLWWPDPAPNLSPELLLAAVETCAAALEFADPGQLNRTMLLAAMRSRGTGQYSALERASTQMEDGATLLADEEVLLAGVARDPEVLGLAHASLRQNKAFVLKCVELQGRALEHADDSLRHCADLQCAAVNQDPMTLKLCDDIQGEKRVVLRAVARNGAALKYAEKSLRKDGEVVLAAAHSDGMGLEYADVSLLQDDAFMVKAIEKCGCAIRYASAALRCTENQQRAAAQDGRALQYADPSLRSSRSVVLDAARAHGGALQFSDPKFCDDKDVVLAGVQSCGSALRFANHTLWNDREVVLAAVANEGRALVYAPTALCCDKEVVLAAVRG